MSYRLQTRLQLVFQIHLESLFSLPMREGELYHTAGQWLGAFSAEVEAGFIPLVHSSGFEA